jgi:hypothetical protein
MNRSPNNGLVVDDKFDIRGDVTDNILAKSQRIHVKSCRSSSLQ